MTGASFYITDGTSYLNLLSYQSGFGFHIQSWPQTIPGYKGGGTYQDSPLAWGRRLIDKQFEDAIEVLDLAANSNSQDGLIYDFQELVRLLEKATDYWTTNWQNDPVWIEAKASCETNTRYAIIKNYRFPNLGNPYAGSFLANPHAFENLTLTLERGPWLEATPGTGTAVETSASESYDGRTLGFSSPTTGPVIAGNRRTVANISDVYNYDDSAASFSGNQMDASLPYSLWPASPATGDIVYIGIDTSLTDSGPFNNLVFDIVQAATGSFDAIWQYWDGASWSSLNAVAFILGSSEVASLDIFDYEAISVLTWEQADDWATTTVNGVTGYWVRVYLSAPTGMTRPNQGNRPIFTAAWNYLRVTSEQIAGDISALARLTVQRLTHNIGGAFVFKNADTFLMAGLRSETRGTDFVSIINLAQEQNPSGVTVSAQSTGGGNTTLVADLQSPTGVAAVYNPTGAESMDDRVIIEIDSTLSDQYYGRYRVFIRHRQTATGDMLVRVGATSALNRTGMGFNPSVAAVVNDDPALLDLGPLTLERATSEQAPVFQIVIQASSSTGTPNLEMYDLILMPVDEVAFSTFYAVPNEDPTDISVLGGYIATIDVNSITVPKNPSLVYLKNNGVSGDLLFANYVFVGDRFALPPNKTFRLYFVTSAVGDPIGALHDVWACQLFRQQRYLGPRGSR